jgi:hypothetical protein
MLSSQARVVTDQPARYVKQLVSHLGHRVTTSVADDGTGLVEFERGRCTLAPEAGVLVLAAVAEDDETMARLQDVVGRHLERFGAKAGLSVDWSPVTPG